MTTFQIFSDIHIECSKEFPRIKPLCDYLILAGDICTITNKNFIPFMEYCSQNWKRVVYVLGNHEFYIRRNKINKYNPRTVDGVNLNDMIAMYKKALEAYPNIHCLENEYIDIHDDLRIYGSTLWTKHVYDKRINDNMFIKNENIHVWSDNEVELLSEYLNLNTKKTIIVSHFPMIRKGTSHPKYDSEDMDMVAYFAWDNLLSNLPRDNIVCCIAGHTHYSFDHEYEGIRYISNQFGYFPELKKRETGINIEGLYTIN
jgi:predicted phosphodiesterase